MRDFLTGDAPCKKCGATEWRTSKRARGYVTRDCVPCTRTYHVKYRRENPEKRRAWLAKYRRENPGKVRASAAKSRRAHPVERRAGSATRRALKLNAPGNGVTAEQWHEMLNASLGICAYCNQRRSLSFDHIEPLTLGGAHDINNGAAVCKPCNSSKHNRPLLLWLAARAAA